MSENNVSLNEFLAAQKQFLINKKTSPDLEYQDLADMRADYYGVSEHRDTTRKGVKILNEFLDAGWDVVPPCEMAKNDTITMKNSVELKSDGTTVSDRLIEICEGEELTPEFLLSAHNLSPVKWKVVSYRNNYWHSQIKGGKRLVMYQSRLTVKPYEEDEISPYAIKEWFENFTPSPILYTKVTPNYGEGKNCLLLPIVDLHYNLLSTKFITGNEYNCQIAKDRFLSVIDDVISRIDGKRIGKIIFPIGNDLFNANGINGTTFKGTQQTNEKDIREAYIELAEVMIYSIAKLATVAPVDVIYIPSNHDKEVTFYFVHNLHTQFRNDENVTVDYSPITNKYRKYGNTILMFSHDAKVDKTGNVVFDEAGEIRADAKFVEVFLAHLHTEMVKQDRNITVRRLPTFSGKSLWSCENNYGSNSLCQSFIINDERNITDIMYTMV